MLNVRLLGLAACLALSTQSRAFTIKELLENAARECRNGSAPHLEDSARPREVKTTISAICYKGLIDEDTGGSIVDIFERSKKKILVINSGGGYSFSAARLGSYLHENGISVVVDGICYSACYVFIFPSGKYKLVTKDSLLAMHIVREWHFNELYTEKRIGGDSLPATNPVPDGRLHEVYVGKGMGGGYQVLGEIKNNIDARRRYFTPLDQLGYIHETIVEYNLFFSKAPIQKELSEELPKQSRTYSEWVDNFKKEYSTSNDVTTTNRYAWSYPPEILLSRFGIMGIVYMWYPRTNEEKLKLKSNASKLSITHLLLE